jgi:hypothetical protein
MIGNDQMPNMNGIERAKIQAYLHLNGFYL